MKMHVKLFVKINKFDRLYREKVFRFQIKLLYVNLMNYNVKTKVYNDVIQKNYYIL